PGDSAESQLGIPRAATILVTGGNQPLLNIKSWNVVKRVDASSGRNQRPHYHRSQFSLRLASTPTASYTPVQMGNLPHERRDSTSVGHRPRRSASRRAAVAVGLR